MKRKIYTEKLIKKEINEIDEEYSYVSMKEFKGNRSKIIINHKLCGRNLEIIFNNFKCGRRCKYCNGNKIDEKKFLEMIKDIDNNYEVKSKYKGLTNYVIFNHKKYGHEFKMKPNDFLYNNYRCPICSNKVPYNKESLSKKIKEKNNEYTLTYFPDDFKGISRSNVIITHKCGYEMNIRPNNFLSNNAKCPICYKQKMFNVSNLSKGAKRIKKFLDYNNINYELEKTFSDLKSPFNNHYLRFDFYLTDYNTLIEFDGKQHFQYSKSSKILTKEKMERTQFYDKMKDDYCKENNIKLIRINFNTLIENKVISTLKKELKRSTTIETFKK